MTVEKPRDIEFLTSFVAMHRSRLLEAFEDDQEWDKVRSSYGIEGLNTPEDELRACLTEVTRWAQARVSDAHPGAQPFRNHLSSLVDDTVDEATSTAPQTGASAGLGAIFANATANVGWWEQQSQRIGATVTSNCQTCGAAQETALVFECEYCGSFLYEDFREDFSS